MTVVLVLATKPSDRARFVGDGDVALAGLMEVERGIAFEPYTEPELPRMANRLDTEDEIIVDGATWSGLPQLSSYLEDDPRQRWSDAMLDLRLRMFHRHDRALGAEAIAQATNGLRRLGPSADPGELVEAANLSAATEALRAEAQVVRDVFTFGRDFGWVQVEKEDGPGFEQLEVDW